MSADRALPRSVPLVVVDAPAVAVDELLRSVPGCSCSVVLVRLWGWPVFAAVAAVAHGAGCSAPVGVEPRLAVVKARRGG